MLRLGFWLEPAQIGCCRSGSCDKTRCAAALWRAPLWLRAEGMRLAADLPQAGREQGDGLGSGQATALIKISHRLKAGDKPHTSKPRKQAS